MKIMKRLMIFLTVSVLIGMTLCVGAADLPRLSDGAGLLSAQQASDLLAVLDEISERQQCDVVVLTEASLHGYGVQAYADDFYDENGYGFGAERDGILLLVDMGERMWALSTSGFGMYAFTDYGLAYLETCFLDALSSGDYAGAFLTFAQECDTLLTLAKQGTPLDYDDADNGYGYDYDYGYDDGYGTSAFDVKSALVSSGVIGLVCAAFAVMFMISQLKSVRQKNAEAYLREGSLQVSDSRDMFLYRNVNKIRRQDDNSSSGGGTSMHRSSSGRSHGGRSGRF